MSVHTVDEVSPKLLENIKSAVELYAIFETANSTVGSQIQVSCEMVYATSFLIVRFRFGDLSIEYVKSYQELECLRNLDSYFFELRGLTRAFVDDILEKYNKLPLPELALALWEDAGIAIGGAW